MISTETPGNRIAVFIDFDNVEIGVKSTIGGQFDIGLVLEAIKERGEIVTKIAYSDWKRAGDYSRVLTQHAIRMVQRNLTPGGDKNGADITMALDALEMAFTHDHINAFVIVGGDSDFISLVEKLKQYGRKVIVVGGRQFTSVTMQKNCHEFIAYENLATTGAGGRGRVTERGKPSPSTAPIAQALPLVRRALKVLSEREVTPQLGLLKSTLLQLDSTFSERNYGASSFRDFMEKVAQAGAVVLRHAGRSMLVEAVEDGASAAVAEVQGPAVTESAPAAAPIAQDVDADLDEEDVMPASPMTPQDGIRAVQQAFGQAATPPRWPMYVRQAKQFLRTAIAGFDERKYGFASVVDLLRAAAKESVLRLERDRQGAIRVFPGNGLTQKAQSMPSDQPMIDVDVEETADVDVQSERVSEPVDTSDIEQAAAEPVMDSPIVDVDVDGEPEADLIDEVNGNVVGSPRKPARARKASGRQPRPPKAKAARTPRPRSRKSARE